MTRVQKKGFTLVELMVVIAIMGILTAMGVAGLQGAVENTRVNDAAKNVTAFLQRTANEANRMSATLCLKVSAGNDHRLNVYKADDCKSLPQNSPAIYSMELESQLKFVKGGCPSDMDLTCESGEGCDVNWLDESQVFKPKLGLSAAPTSGHVCVQYGNTEHYAAAVKSNTKNFIVAVTCDEGDCE